MIAIKGPPPLVGTVLTLPGSSLAELLSDPWDVVWIDLEHAALDRSSALELLLGAQAARTLALVRVPSQADSRQLAAAMLDAGADGIVAPNVNNAGRATELVRSLRHPPAGERGYGPRRQALRARTDHGVIPRSPLFWAQIESREGVDAAGEIAAVDGVDALILGVADLSYALGVPLDLDAAEIAAAAARVRDAAAQAGAMFGIAGPIIDADGSLHASALSDVIASAGVLVHSTDARLCAAAVDRAAAQLRALLIHEPVEAT